MTVNNFEDVPNGSLVCKIDLKEAEKPEHIEKVKLRIDLNMIREYEEAEEYDKEDLRYLICAEVSAGSSFTAFKRWILWDHKDRYGEVLQFCGLSECVS